MRWGAIAFAVSYLLMFLISVNVTLLTIFSKKDIFWFCNKPYLFYRFETKSKYFKNLCLLQMNKKQIIRYLVKNKDIISIRAISRNSGFSNLSKVLAGQVDKKGFAFTFPDKHVPKVLKEIKRLQAKIDWLQGL